MSEEGGGLYREGGAKGRILASMERAREKDPWKGRSEGMRCRSCVFYVPKARGDGRITTSEHEIGRCRRNAPTMRGFPAVFPQDWCGEHRIDENRI